jgi:hypothetical protein
MVVIGLAIGMDGITCDDYGSAEEAVMNQAMASHIDGVEADDFGDHVCTDVSRRRRLLSGSISIYTEMNVDPTEHDDDVMGSITSAVATAHSSGALASSITQYAEAAGVTIAITVTGVTVTTMPPSSAPTAKPTVVPTTAVVGGVDDEFGELAAAPALQAPGLLAVGALLATALALASSAR